MEKSPFPSPIYKCDACGHESNNPDDHKICLVTIASYVFTILIIASFLINLSILVLNIIYK